MSDTADQGGTDRSDRAERPLPPVRLTLAAGSTPRRLQLVDEQGTSYTLDITPELRTAVRGDSPRRLETQMSSSIRPREIQTRIRAGESAEAVAEAAGTTVDAIMPYVGPVLAEREHVAGRAQKASVRRTPGEGNGPTQSRVLGDAVAAHLRGRGADPAAVAWDAYRRDTGRWVLTGTFDTDERGGVARFTYDAPGNYVLSDNDDARWLIGDVLPVVETPPARDDLQQVRERRLAAVPAEELPLGDAALPLGDSFDEALDLAGAVDQAPAAPAAPAASAPAAPVSGDEPLRATADEVRAAAAAESGTEAGADTGADAEDERARHRRPVQKKRGRASVPSWDEIMFGGGDQ